MRSLKQGIKQILISESEDGWHVSAFIHLESGKKHIGIHTFKTEKECFEFISEFFKE